MLRLIQVEFMKIKRQKFIILTLLASLLVPFPWCIVCIRDNLGFQNLFQGMLVYGGLLFLPCVLCIAAATLFYREEDYDTLKNILMVPVSKTSLVLSKMTVLLVLSAEQRTVRVQNNSGAGYADAGCICIFGHHPYDYNHAAV